MKMIVALALFVLSRTFLRTDAGKDFQSRVMGDTASTGTGSYAAANYIGLTENTGAPAAGDTTLAGEISGEGLTRAQATYAHTAGASTYTLTKAFTKTSGAVRTIAKGAVFNASSAGSMPFETLITPNAILDVGDSVTITWTVNL